MGLCVRLYTVASDSFGRYRFTSETTDLMLAGMARTLWAATDFDDV
jgi:hypothetical protein